MTDQKAGEDLVTNSGVPQTKGQRRSNLSSTIPIVVGLGLVALLVFGFLSPREERPKVGEPAPEFTLTTFDGSRFSLSERRGQIIVLNFWASWCSPCREEAPALQAVWQDAQNDVLFLGITYHDAQSASRKFIETFGITYENGLDVQGQISRAYGVTAVPETYIIDRDGNIAWLHIGALDSAVLSEQIKDLQGR